MDKSPLIIYLATPRGFCAGVDRAIQIVKLALAKYGAPVYVHHEIVHNRYVVESLRRKGAVFVEKLEEIPTLSAHTPVIFSAHGVAKSVQNTAQARNFFVIDATCPLVSKVHREAERHYKDGHQVILIGHANHPEVIGTMGQLPPDNVVLVENCDDVAKLPFYADTPLSYVTQTTLSVDDTAEIIAALRARYPHIQGPRKEDICYATHNRQQAVKEIAPQCDLLLVIGAPNSSNSMRLVEVALRSGCPQAWLVERAHDIKWEWFDQVSRLGLTAGASAPEELVNEVINAIKQKFAVTVEPVELTREDMVFKLPSVLTKTNSKLSQSA